MRIHVVFASVGRAAMLRRTVARMNEQTRIPDGILVVGASEGDVEGLAEACPGADIVLAAKGLCKQRNAALDRLSGQTDAIVFFDDDFVPANNYLAEIEKLLESDPALAGLTGHLAGDGAQTGEIEFSAAVETLDVTGVRPNLPDESRTWLYGCNMVIRLASAGDLRFDEKLPLYGWQEDVDFTNQLSRRGRLVCTSRLTGIHLGTRGGRTSGLRLGYSQVVNVVYLLRKGTIGWWHGTSLMARNIAANLVRSLRPEPEIDRRGRLVGNIRGLLDCARGRIDPCRIEAL